jgi:hypothetical protein
MIVEKFFNKIKLESSEPNKIINNFLEKIIHPLNFGADEFKMDIFLNDIQNVIKYEDYTIMHYGNHYYEILTQEEESNMYTQNQIWEEEMEKEYEEEVVKIIANRKSFLTIREYYKTLTDLTNIFLNNQKIVNHDMNEMYIFLKKEVCQLLKQVNFLSNTRHNLNYYFPFTTDLFSSESEWQNKGLGPLDWNKIRPLMFEQLSKINSYIRLSDSPITTESSEQMLRKIQDRITSFELKKNELSKSNPSNINKKVSENIKSFQVSINDREIKVNNYILSKPHAVGKNLDFFQYIFDNSDKELKISDTPTTGKRPIKILNDIGFTKDLYKAFFPKRSNKKTLLFKKEVDADDLKKSGIRIEVLIKQLELLNAKNSPE